MAHSTEKRIRQRSFTNPEFLEILVVVPIRAEEGGMGGTSVDRLPCHSQRKTDSKEPSPSFLMIANDCYEPMTHCQQTSIISQISMTTCHRIILHEFSWVLDGHWIERESSNDVSARQSDCRYFRIKPSKFKQPCDARVSWFELTNCIGSAGSCKLQPEREVR